METKRKLRVSIEKLEREVVNLNEYIQDLGSRFNILKETNNNFKFFIKNHLLGTILMEGTFVNAEKKPLITLRSIGEARSQRLYVTEKISSGRILGHKITDDFELMYYVKNGKEIKTIYSSAWNIEVVNE